MFPLLLISLLVAIALFVWADRGWIWIFPLVFVSSNTYFDLGFKLYTHEWALSLFALGVAPRVVSRWLTHQEKDPAWKPLFYLTLYIGLHCLVSLGLAYIDRTSGYGNIVRRYSGALWGPVFAHFLMYHDVRRHLKLGLVALFFGFALRAFTLLFTYFTQRTLLVPSLNLIFPVSTDGLADDLRQSSLGLGLMCMALAVGARVRWKQAVGWAGYALFLLGVLLGGGRASLGMYLVLPLIWMALSRRYIAGIAFVSMVVLGVGTINVKPALLEQLEPRMQRTLSIAVFERGTLQVHSEVEGSDYYHTEMRHIAFERWLASPISLFFGNRVRGFDKTYHNFIEDRMTPEQLLEIGTETGIYEAGWLNVIAVTGGFGVVLYLSTMYMVCRLPMRRIRVCGLMGPEGAVSFLAICSITTWLLFGWTTGGFPLMEILFGVMATIACRQELIACGPHRAPMAPESRIQAGFSGRRYPGQLSESGRGRISSG